MFRGLLSSRLIQVGLVFFVVVVSGSLLYSWQTRRATVAEFTRTDVVPHETRSEQDTVDTSTVDFEQTGTLLEVDDSQMADDSDVSPIDKPSEVLDTADAFSPEKITSDEALAEDLPVSPFGFGPYPGVPAGFPEKLTPSWLWPTWKQESYGSDLRDFELMSRVLIKLWNQGKQNFNGVSKSDKTGLIYPSYPNTIYVTYDVIETPDGKPYQYVSHIKSGLGRRLTHQEQNQLDKGITPAGVRVLNMATDGINPYTFLNLQ